MACVISFTTKKFEGANEPPNAINPIAGQSVLMWMRGELRKKGWDVSEPDAEDWGWYMMASRAGTSYLVGAGGEMSGEILPNDWIVQIDKHRTLIQKLTGANKMTGDDTLSREIESVVRGEAGFENIHVEKSF